MNDNQIIVRLARPAEIEAINDLIVRSKGHWGYAPAFLAAYRTALRLSPAMIAAGQVYCAEVDGRLAGMLRLTAVSPTEAELDHLFVEPEYIGQGVGRRLWRQAIDLAGALGAQALVFDSDPHARPFYERLGAVAIGQHPSTVIAGLMIPRLRYQL